MALDLKKYVKSYPNFPKPHILFRDIAPLLANGKAYQQTVDEIVKYAKNKKVDVVVGPEARGFVIGSAVAYKLGVGFVPVRKEGKLPGDTIKQNYKTEYGESSLYIQKGAIKPGQRVLVIDDLLATSGTIDATIKLIESLGGIVVGVAFVIELMDLHGRDKLKDYDILSLIKY